MTEGVGPSGSSVVGRCIVTASATCAAIDNQKLKKKQKKKANHSHEANKAYREDNQAASSQKDGRQPWQCTTYPLTMGPAAVARAEVDSRSQQWYKHQHSLKRRHKMTSATTYSVRSLFVGCKPSFF